MGAIVTKLEFIDQQRVTQTDHQVFFAGSVPHGLDRKPIPNLGVRSASLILSEACGDVAVQWALSNKPKDTGRFADFFDKVESYVAIISGPAMEAQDVTPFTFRVVEDVPTDYSASSASIASRLLPRVKTQTSRRRAACSAQFQPTAGSDPFPGSQA